ncbi:hypothetical protein [Streptomyces chartreusis]|uniref:hypothetical protein n=1 Tax=Streptomyces chartreusis TaxID=1969 RepID=UPI003410FCF3
MSPDSAAPGLVRPAAVVNQAIRALWSDPRTQLSAAERAELERLYEEWSAAVRGEVDEAA